MSNEAFFSVAGYVATEPKPTLTSSGVPTVSMRLAWTPRRFDKATGEWTDEPSSFASVRCFRKLAQNAAICLRKGDPVVVTGTMRIRDYDAKDGTKRTNVDVLATSIGPDLSRRPVSFNVLRPSAEHAATEQAAGRAGSATADGQDPGDDAADDLTPADDMLAENDIDEDAEAPAEPVAAPF
jgi:single-strand DNA-binding protein